jgi:hypothetical protein
VISIHEVTEFGSILKKEQFLDGVLKEKILGHIKIIRDCCDFMYLTMVLLNGILLSETRIDLCNNILTQIQNKYLLLV